MSETEPLNHSPELEKDKGTSSFDRNAEARSQGQAFDIPQLRNEPDDRYRERLSGILRSQGRIIEAHEVYSGRRWDDPEQGRSGSMLGIVGAVAMAREGVDFRSDGEHKIGDDIAAGIIVNDGENSTRSTIRTIFDIVGPSIGMDMIDAMFGKNR